MTALTYLVGLAIVAAIAAVVLIVPATIVYLWFGFDFLTAYQVAVTVSVTVWAMKGAGILCSRARRRQA